MMLLSVLFRSVIYPFMLDMLGLSKMGAVSDKANSFKLNTGVPFGGKSIFNPDIPTLMKWFSKQDRRTSNDDIPSRGLMFIYKSLTSVMLGVIVLLLDLTNPLL